MNKISLLIIVTFTFLSCANKIENIDRAFYYWKSDNWQLSQKEDSIRDVLKVNKLYVKFFEVDHSDAIGNFPISKTNLRIYNKSDSLNVIPTIYLKNSVFNSSKGSLDTLADNVNFLINKYCNEKFRNTKPITELQMDCDWTLKTKDNYFYFLKKLKDISKKQISCTLRLYPYKYRDKMGVPPVDKVTLMCYNLMNPLESHNKNSILDLEVLNSYLNTKSKYPLPIDIALPVYSWMQVYQNNRFTNVLYTNNKEIKKILKEVKPFWFEVTKDTVVNQTYLRIGDKIKFEEISTDKIINTIELIKKNVKFEKNTTIALFHLDEQQLDNYSYEELSRFYSDFNK
jgi:hypothetical protein